MTTNQNTQRYKFLDALRGLAVLLMMEQNIGIWLWRSDGPMIFSRHPFLFSLNGVGGLAGPLFITLAGIGSAFFELRHARIDRILMSRGLGIMLFGYLMNLLNPGFFSVGSWFTLHMIGFAILITPLLRRLTTQQILLLAGIVILLTGMLQYYLGTPAVLSDYHMRSLNLPGGALRLMLAEGHYPVFPWLSFYLMGMVTGRLFMRNQLKQIISLATAMVLVGVLLLLLFYFEFSFTKSAPAALFFRLNLGSFPTPPLFVLLFFPVVTALFLIFNSAIKALPDDNPYGLASLGRISLSLQIVHVVIFYEVSQRLRFFRTFSTVETLVILAGVLTFSVLLAIFWQKYNFKYSFEWTLRRIAG